jgi:hypothetical protein
VAERVRDRPDRRIGRGREERGMKLFKDAQAKAAALPEFQHRRAREDRSIP